MIRFLKSISELLKKHLFPFPKTAQQSLKDQLPIVLVHPRTISKLRMQVGTVAQHPTPTRGQ